jgi:ATP-dependent RNA helicase RhlE
VLPKQRQNLLFSATFSDEIRTLARGLLHDPLTVEVAPRNAPAELVEHRVHLVEQGEKRAVLSHLLREGATPQTLVFTRTKHGANRLAEQLGRDGINCAAIHGNKSQGARQAALGGFRDGKVRVLVATDIMARGIDVPDISHVVNYELPEEPESYVHRIGRTARAGRDGEAVSFCSPEERPLLKQIERLTKVTLTERKHQLSAAALAAVPAPQADARPPRAQQGRGQQRGHGGGRNGGGGRQEQGRGRQSENRQAQPQNRNGGGRGGAPNFMQELAEPARMPQGLGAGRAPSNARQGSRGRR